MKNSDEEILINEKVAGINKSKVAGINKSNLTIFLKKDNITVLSKELW
ncbi:hypothetical protein [uncultured Acetobacterium sp.]|nr:hypothetical protein [uncultured Acetobacterium sp.]